MTPCGFPFPPTQLRVCFTLLFRQANRPPAKLNLLTCQVKTNPEEKKCFDLISRKFVSQTPRPRAALQAVFQGLGPFPCARGRAGLEERGLHFGCWAYCSPGMPGLTWRGVPPPCSASRLYTPQCLVPAPSLLFLFADEIILGQPIA